MHYLISIGIILAIIGILLIVMLKAPLKLNDKLLIGILSTFLIKFSLDEASLITESVTLSGVAAIFGISSIATCGWYIKYLTDTKAKFGMRQAVVYAPLFFLAVPVIIVVQRHSQQLYPTTPYRYVLAVMASLVLCYFGFCIDMLHKHRKLIKAYYSGEPGNITVTWIIVVLTLQIAEFFLKGILARYFNNPNLQIITNEFCFIIETFLLVVLGIWQKSIPVFIAGNDEISNAATDADSLKRYKQKLEKFMEERQPYLDPELTIEKLSELTGIRKILLSQTLNKELNKNFFTFIKEYRIKYVEQTLKNRLQRGATIMDIAYQSGFNSKTGFNRAFKEVTGKTPTSYLNS